MKECSDVNLNYIVLGCLMRAWRVLQELVKLKASTTSCPNFFEYQAVSLPSFYTSFSLHPKRIHIRLIPYHRDALVRRKTTTLKAPTGNVVFSIVLPTECLSTHFWALFPLRLRSYLSR